MGGVIVPAPYHTRTCSQIEIPPVLFMLYALLSLGKMTVPSSPHPAPTPRAIASVASSIPRV